MAREREREREKTAAVYSEFDNIIQMGNQDRNWWGLVEDNWKEEHIVGDSNMSAVTASTASSFQLNLRARTLFLFAFL